MKNLILTFMVGLLASSVSYAATEEEKVVETIKVYERALNGNDVKTIMDLYDSSPTFMPQHSPAQTGRKAVEIAYENVFKNIDLDVVFTIHDVETLGSTAWVRTSSAGKTKILANGAVISEGNNELFILKKQNGEWKIHQYLFSTNQPRK